MTKKIFNIDDVVYWYVDKCTLYGLVTRIREFRSSLYNQKSLVISVNVLLRSCDVYKCCSYKCPLYRRVVLATADLFEDGLLECSEEIKIQLLETVLRN